MKSSQLISLALSQLDCNQKELAKTLGVSQTQITKWKKDEHMSYDMKLKIKDTLGIDDEISTDLLEFAGSTENANRWIEMLKMMQDDAAEDRDVPYASSLIEEDDEFFICTVPAIIRSLKLAGFELSPTLPDDLLPKDIPEASYQLDEEVQFNFDEHPQIKVISGIFGAIYDLEAFWSAYLCDLAVAREDDVSEGELIIDSHMAEYAVFKYIEEKMDKANPEKKAELERMFPYFSALRDDIRPMIIDEVIELKKYAIKNNIPLEAELMDFITEHHNSLGASSEHEAFGFNKTRIHPDIYMNEILASQRLIHAVLPVILKKLDIDPSQFANVKLRNDI